MRNEVIQGVRKYFVVIVHDEISLQEIPSSRNAAIRTLPAFGTALNLRCRFVVVVGSTIALESRANGQCVDSLVTNDLHALGRNHRRISGRLHQSDTVLAMVTKNPQSH